MTLNPQRKLPDGVTVPFNGQKPARALAPGNTVELRPGEWAFGPDTLRLSITAVRESGDGFWLDGTDERGTEFSHVLVPRERAGAVEERWRRSHR